MECILGSTKKKEHKLHKTCLGTKHFTCIYYNSLIFFIQFNVRTEAKLCHQIIVKT